MRKGMRLTIGKKLNGLIIALQLLSISGVVLLATQLFTSDLTGLLRKGTLDASAMLSGRVRAEMKHVADRARILGAASLEEYKYDEDKLRFLVDNLATDPLWIGLSLYRRDTPTTWAASWRILHPDYAKKLSLTKEDFDTMDKDFPLDLQATGRGEVAFVVAKLKDGTPSIRMSLPLVQQSEGVFSQVLVIELHQDHLTALFSEATAYAGYLVDRRGRVLASTDPATIPLGSDMRPAAIVAGLANNKAQSGQLDFVDPQGVAQLGAFQRVGFADLTVVSQVPRARAELAQKQLYRRTSFLAGAFLCLALCLGFLFSQSITKPIKSLALAAEKVASGDFSVRLPGKGSSNRADEIQQFSGTFNQMVSGLAERDRVKATFAKFHSKEMADKVLSGELKLGGERKAAAVFFSDVRGFTAMSEGLDPEALVKILNRYMSRMVSVILRNGGIVDKYVGDAIMAVWGVPISKDDDCLRAVRACVEMRIALNELNEEFIAEGLPPIKIGMGLNHGPLISGNIGSEERMEFTVIGDTVNTASRIESLTKEFGTDLLISREILNRVEGKFVVEKASEVKVKGKAEPLTVYKVHGYLDEQGREVMIETPYSDYASEKSDKVVHDAPKDAAPQPAGGEASEEMLRVMLENSELKSLIAVYEEQDQSRKTA
jgi:adenylate cyclase